MRLPKTCFLLLSLLAVTPTFAAETQTSAPSPSRWPGFLRSDSLATLKPDSLPLTWSPDKIAWKAHIPGDGQSSPVAWGQTAFVTSVEGKNKDTYHVSAFNLQDGKNLWTHSLPSTAPVESTYLVSRAAPTPVCDDHHLFAFFESGDVVALTHDGKEAWKRSLSQDYGKFDNQFGLAASPVQNDTAIFILIDHGGPSYLIALSKQDGKTLWKTPRNSRRSWSSPYLATIEGQPQIVCSSMGSVDGYDPVTGKQLWTFDNVGGNTMGTPVVSADGHFLVGASSRASEGTSEKAERSNLLAHVSRDGNEWKFTVDWIAAKARGSFSSPFLAGDCAYWINTTGVLFCLDLKTGKELYSKRLSCGSCWATPIAVGERIYFFGKDGETTILKSGPRFEELSTGNRLWEKVDPPPRPPEPAKPATSSPTTTPPATTAPAANSPTASNPSAAPSNPNQPNKDASPRREADPAARRQAMANASGPIQYAAIILPGTILIRSGDTLFALHPPKP